jgi:hypothetical protein
MSVEGSAELPRLSAASVAYRRPVERTWIVPGAARKPRIISVAEAQPPAVHSLAVTSRCSE